MAWRKRRWTAVITVYLLLECSALLSAVHIKEGNEKIFTAGQDFMLTCEGQGTLNWTYPNQGTDRVSIQRSSGRSILKLKDSEADDTGFYTCISDEPGEQLSDIYIYVSDNNALFTSFDNTALQGIVGGNLTIPCRVTNPAVNVTLFQNNMPLQHEYNPRVGFVLLNIDYSYHGSYICIATYKDYTDELYLVSYIKAPTLLPRPFIEGNKEFNVREGDDIHLACGVKIHWQITHNLFWTRPDGQIIHQDHRVHLTRKQHGMHSRAHHPVPNSKELYIDRELNLTIISAKKTDEGDYSCVISNPTQNKSEVVKVVVLERNASYIKFKSNGAVSIITVNDGIPLVKWAVGYDAVPQPKFKWLAPSGKEIVNSIKYQMATNAMQTILNITSVTPSDAGVYVLVGEAGELMKEKNFTLLVNALPTVKLSESHVFLNYSKKYEMKCVATSYPLADIKWLFYNCTGFKQCDENGKIIKQEHCTESNCTSNTTIEALSPGTVQCQACNSLGCKSDNWTFFIQENEKTFTISYPKVVPIEGDDVKLKCSASKYIYAPNITWSWREENKGQFKLLTSHKGIITMTKFSIENNLEIVNVSPKKHRGQYLCKAWNKINHTDISDFVDLVIKEKKPPTFKTNNKIYMRYNGSDVKLDCTFDGTPKPEIIWLKEGRVFSVEENTSRMRFLNDNQELEINPTEIEDSGVYSCIISNIVGAEEKNFKLLVTNAEKVVSMPPSTTSNGTIAAIAIIFIVLLVAVVCLILRILKERKRVNMLTNQDIVHFHEGALLTIDPDLGMDEQADLLPYNKDYEFPREKLIFGKQLGCGAFGRVVKAEAEGIKEEEKYTTVAVKMVKPHSDISHLKALMTELKILIYIGHHLNVLNLLGACTTELRNKELLVIVEYCRYGNLHSYLQRHRESFTNQVNEVTDEIDFTIGEDAIPEPIIEDISLDPSGATSNGSTVVFNSTSGQLLYSDSSGNNSLMGDCTGGSDMPTQVWNITYKSDFKGKLAVPLCTKDLLNWSFQVGKGMEYLSSVKIVHADLAARNILLADNNIVKICDFGLARNLYKNIDYKKKGQDPLPIKWMAIESIEDRVFSTKSDVWSFGIVLWELFTLAKTPYPGLEVNEEFLKRLLQGHRMEKPKFSTHNMYKIMLDCWKAKPSDRPNFSDLVQQIGDIMNAEMKEHYIELSAPYQNFKTGNTNDYFKAINQNDSDYILPGKPNPNLYINVSPMPEYEHQEPSKTVFFKKIDSTISEDSDYLSMTK